MKNILAIDYGTKRIGLAVADDELKIPLLLNPIEIPKGNSRVVYEKINKICEKLNISFIVIGLPLSFDFKETPICQKIREFGDELEKTTQRKVIYQNEVLTTEEAIKIQESINKRKRNYHTSPKLDSQAAALILETFLSFSQNNQVLD